MYDTHTPVEWAAFLSLGVAVHGGFAVPFFLLVEFEMKASQEMVHGRRKQHRNHRQKEHAAEQRVRCRKQLRFWCGNRVDRPHARQDHRGIEDRIEPGEIVEPVIAGGADGNSGEYQRGDDAAIAREPTNERPAHRAPCSL